MADVTNVYRNNPDGEVITILQNRSGLYKSGPHYKAATRNPAYFILTGKGDGGTAKVPEHQESFPKTQFVDLKPYPSLEEATISYTPTEYGFKEGITWSIRCFNKSQFTKLEAVFCRYGTEISVQFGYAKHWQGEQTSIKLEKFLLCTYEFNTDDQGCWIIRGSAVRASEALKKLELFIGGNFDGLYYQSGGKQYPVKGLQELMTYDAQQNGQKAIDDIQFAGQDGVTFIPNKNHSYNKAPGAVCVYKSSHTSVFSGRLTKAWQAVKEKWLGANSTTSSTNIVYYSLEYIVNRLIMGHCHLRYKDGMIPDTKYFAPTAIVFDDKLSRCTPYEAIISGLPTQVVLCGQGKGKYSGPYSVGDELGINFEAVGGAGVGPITACTSFNQGAVIVDPKKIIFERSVVLNSFEEAAKREDSNSDKVNDKYECEESINVSVFLQKLFKVVKEASGGSIELTLTQHPNKPDELLIVDQRNGENGTLKCISFNGIDGDGSSRSITLRSNAGSDEMASAIMAGQTNQGDAVHNIRPGKLGQIDGKRASTLNKALTAKFELITSPATLIETRFDSDQETSLMSAMNGINKGKPSSHTKIHDLPVYPGLELEVTMDGVYGWKIGNAIYSNHLPDNYYQNKGYFMVRSVIHKFTPSDWETQLSGLLSFYQGMQKPIQL